MSAKGCRPTGNPKHQLGQGSAEPHAPYPSWCLGFPNRLRPHAGACLAPACLRQAFKASFDTPCGTSVKVIPEKEHPIKNLIRRQKIESTKDTKGTNKSMYCSCLSCFSWTILSGGFIIGNHLKALGSRLACLSRRVTPYSDQQGKRSPEQRGDQPEPSLIEGRRWIFQIGNLINAGPFFMQRRAFQYLP